MNEPTAPCRDLGTMIQIYPDDKRLSLHVPARDFDRVPEAGEEVVIAGRANHANRPDLSGPTVRGRVKRIVVEVEVDLATLEEPRHEGQGTLG